MSQELLNLTIELNNLKGVEKRQVDEIIELSMKLTRNRFKIPK
jgi:hypothetical protein